MKLLILVYFGYSVTISLVPPSGQNGDWWPVKAIEMYECSIQLGCLWMKRTAGKDIFTPGRQWHD